MTYSLRVSFILLVLFASALQAQIQVPTITSFTPTLGPVGTSVLISGTNFNSNSTKNIVYFGAVKASVTSGTTTGLTVNVPTGASYSPITVTDTTTGLTAYSNAPFKVTFSSSQFIDATAFAAKVDFAAGTSPFAVAIGDLDGDGKPDLAVTNTSGTTLSIFRNTSTSGSITAGSFAAKVDFTTGTEPQGIAIGDIDGDGKLDLVVTNGGTTNTISVFRNTSTPGSITTGSFAAKVDFATGSNPYSVAIGDIDGDGKPDIAVTNNYANTVSIFRNTSTSGSITAGSFAPKVDFATGATPAGVAIGDIDGDGKPDLVVANANSNSVSVFRNTSTSGSITAGSFASRIDFTAGTSPQGNIALGDIDGDGKLDVVITNFYGNNVSIFRNTSVPGSITTSSFASRLDLATGVGPRGVAIADVDGDGKPDLVFTITSSNSISVFRNISTPGTITSSSFVPKVDFTTGTNPNGIAICDFDGDGKPDLVTTNYTSNTVSVLRNTVLGSNLVAFYPFNNNTNDESGNGNNGTENGGVTKTTDRFGNTNSAYSFDGVDDYILVGDPIPDNLKIQNEITLSAWINISQMPSAELAMIVGSQYDPTGSGASIMVDGRVNADGQTNPAGHIHFQIGNGSWHATNANSVVPTNTWVLITAVRKANEDAKIYYNDQLQPSTSVAWDGSITYNSSWFAIGLQKDLYRRPFNGSIDDIRIYSRALSAVEIDSLYNEGGKALTPNISSFTPTTGPIGTAVTITGTNFSTTPANNIVWFGAVKATVTAATSTSLTVTVPTGATYQPITVTVNGLTTYSSKPFIVTFSSSQVIDATTFAFKVDFTSGSNPYYAALGDIDGDGKADLVVANYTSNTVSVFRNTSTAASITAGSFATKVDFATGSGPNNVVVGDIDGDGKLDVIVANSASNTVSVFRNTSSSGSITAGSLAARIDFATGVTPKGACIGDIDGDGKPDLVVGNVNSNTISVFKNTSTLGSITAGSLAAKIDFATGTYPNGLAIGDIDGDGKPDLAVADFTGNTVSVFRNISTNGSIGTGSFSAKVDFPTGLNPYFVAISDIDGDGKPDLAVTNYNSNTISIFRNTSNSGSITAASFATKVDFNTGTSPVGVGIGDIDGDGKPDLATANWSSNTVSVFRNTSTSGSINAGSFASKVDLTTGSSPYYALIADIDGDGKPDLVTSNYASSNISVLRNTMPAAASRVVTFQADMTQLLAAGFNASTDSVAVNGSFNSWWAPHKMFRVGSTSVWQDTVSIVGNAGDTVLYKFTAFPYQKFLNAGWETGNNRIYVLTASSATLPAVQPAIGVKTGTIANDVTVNFRVDMTGAREVYGNTLIANLKTVWMAGDNLPLQWPIIWTYPDTAFYLIRMYDNGTHGDAVAGDNIWSVSLVFLKSNYVTDTIQYKFGADYTGVQNLNSGVRYLDNEFANGNNRTLVLNDSAGALPMTVSNKFGSMATSPSAPTNLSATVVSSTQINLGWTASTTGSPTWYRIYRSLTSGTGFSKIDSVSGSTTTYNNTGLSASTTYYYLVYAVNAGGQSAGSNQASATTLSGTVTVPSAPGGLTASAVLSSQINLSWTASATGSPTLYRIYRSLTSGTGFSKIDSVSASTTTYSNTGLSVSTTYYYLVYAVNAGGQSAASNQASASTPAATASITVTTPASNWATTYTYGIQWTSQNLTGNVNIRLSLDKGSTFSTTIATAITNSGSYSWTIPSTQGLSNTCILRVESSTNTAIYGLSRVFALVSGSSKSSTQTFTVAATYSANPTSNNEYRLVSFPGEIKGINVSQLNFSGTQDNDWKMFSEPGNGPGFVQMNTGSTMKTGEGYWYIQRGSLSKSVSFPTPTLNNDATASITLTGGTYSIIGNPFNVSVPWSSVLVLNGLASNTPLFSWVGKWSSSDTLMQPGIGYYFNSNRLTTLLIPYAAFGFPSQIPGEQLKADWRLQLVFESELNKDDDNYIGIAGGTSLGKDRFEFNKPPLIFDESFVYMKRSAWNTQNDLYYNDYRPEVGEGQTWDFEITNPSKSLGKLSVMGVEDVPSAHNVYLVNEETGVTFNLRRQDWMQYGYGRTSGHFKVVVGPETYVSQQLQTYMPKEYRLEQNYPNPFNPSTTVTFKMPKGGSVRLEVFSLLGQRIKVLAEGRYEAGVHQVVWMGDNERGARVASGVYFCRFVNGKNSVQTKKMLLTK